jgi:hypothetical protein
MKTWIIRLIIAPVMAVAAAAPGAASTHEGDGQLKLSYTDGRQATVGVDEVNQVLRSIGVRITRVSVPDDAAPIVVASTSRALTREESMRLLSLFQLDREQLLEEIRLAGRQPGAHRGGFLSTSEIGVAPYPKVYDLKALPPADLQFAQEKFGKLHVNSSEDGVGIDEVMTVVSGGPWTWFFRLPDGVVAKLSLGAVRIGGLAWRLSYPGLVPHGAFLDADHGLIVAHAHGPRNFVLRYEDPSIDGAELLGANPWIDFSGEAPKLRD